MKPAIPRLHVLTDEVLQNRYSHVELAQLCASSGADAIQFREKRDHSISERTKIADAMLRVCNQNDALLVVNDFVDIAKAIGAPAVHLGRSDEAIEAARARLATDSLIGGTANSYEEALTVASLDCDYLGVGPVFGTKSKKSAAAALHLAGLAQICDAVAKPVIAIGNIQLKDVHDVLSCGAHGIAVISAIVCAGDVERATRDFCVELGI